MFLCKYSAYTRQVQSVYLPVTPAVENHPAHLMVRVEFLGRLVHGQQVAPTRIMQGLRLFLCCDI
jgi:hypothetical protein